MAALPGPKEGCHLDMGEKKQNQSSKMMEKTAVGQ